MDSEDAVSPVIGVVLMLAVTVALVAVVGTYAMGLSEEATERTPRATFTFAYDGAASGRDDFGHVGGGGDYDGRLTVTHDGGDALEARSLALVGASSEARVSFTAAGLDGTSRVRPGVSVDVWVTRDDVVRVVWVDPSDGTSATLQRWKGPDA